MSRKLGDWLTGYLQLCKDTEPPKSYHTWVGLSMIAAALQRKVYLRWGFDFIYPNMYVVLIGPSGKTRKGTALKIGRAIFNELGLPLTAETITREKLINKLAESTQSFNDKAQRKVIHHCSLYTISDELSVFLGQGDVRFLADLTDWYDCREEWKYETKNSGNDHLRNICFNLLGATAPDWLTSILPQEAIGGGFTSRIIFVVEERKGKTIGLPPWTPAHEKLRADLVHDLQVIKNLQGEYTMDPDATKIYTDWYERYDEQIKTDNIIANDTRFAGYCERRATHLRKMCMQLSASRGNSMIITAQDFERAQTILAAIEKKMPRVFAGLGQARYARMVQELLDFILIRGTVTRSELMQVYYRDVDHFSLEIIEQVLSTMGAVKIIKDLEHNETIYKALVKPTISLPTMEQR